MRSILRLAIALIASMPVPAMAQFLGTVEFAPDSTQCALPDQRRLASQLEYIDSRGTGWVAAEGNCTDGASIPGIFQRIVGEPFDSDLLSAAVIHDHYCDRRVRSWPETHWVFYDALRASGVSRRRALTMYFAVMAAGPKWIALIEPRQCGVGENCLMQVPATTLPNGFRSVATPENTRFATREPSYDDPEFLAALEQVEAEFAYLDTIEDWTEQADAEAFALMHQRALAFLGQNDPAVRFAVDGLVFSPQSNAPATE